MTLNSKLITQVASWIQLNKKFVIIGVSLLLFLFIIITTFFFFYFNPTQKSSDPTKNSVVSPTPTPTPKLALLTVITGSATVKTHSEEMLLKQSQSLDLENRSTVITDSDSIAVIDYEEGTLLRLSPGSSVFVQQEDTSLSIKQIIGNVYYRFTKIAGIKEAMNVKSGQALASVRGTSFSVYQNGSTKITVHSHVVDVYQVDATGEPILSSKISLDASQEAEISSESASLSATIAALPVNYNLLQKSWMSFNEQADMLYDKGDTAPEALLELTSQYFIQITPTPTPTPTPGPSATPTSKPIPKISEMLGTGYQTGQVQTDVGTYSLSCYGANKGSVRVITDSANDSDCKNDCPVKALHEYVQANGGNAGMNGMYFCPADYPACADKKNSFDTLLFNSRTRSYINSDNNVYSTIPFLVVDGGGNPRFVSQSLEWGRDTGISAGIAGNPLLVRGGEYVAENGSLDDKQRNTKSNRGAFVQKGDNLYLCVVRSATVPDSGKVYKALNVDNAINIDGGGSTALWAGGYKFGPGRAIPNAIIFTPR